MNLQADINAYERDCEIQEMAYERARAMAAEAVKDNPFVFWNIQRFEEQLNTEAPDGMLAAAVACAYDIDCDPDNNPWAGNEARAIFDNFCTEQVEALTQYYLEHHS